MTSMDSIDHATALPLEPSRFNGLSSGEMPRKAYPMLAGTPSFALRALSPVTMAIIYTFLMLWNTFIWRVLPNSYRAIWRPNEHNKGIPSGLVLYCGSVIGL